MSIEIRRTGSVDYGRYLKVLICGNPGVGKTLISSTFPNPLYASAEGGLMSIADRGIPYIDIRTSDALLSIKTTLDQSPDVREKMFGFPVDTLVVDTIDEIQRILIRERIVETKKESLQLQDWGWLGEQMQALIRGLRNLEMNVVLTCHLKETTDAETGKVFFKPQMQGAMGDQLPAFVDLALLLRSQSVVQIVEGEARRSTVRVLQTYQDAQHTWIKDRSGKLPPEMSVDFHTDYKRLSEAVFSGIADLGDPESTSLPGPTLVHTTPSPSAPAEADRPTSLTVVGSPDIQQQTAGPPVPKPDGPLLPKERAAKKEVNDQPAVLEMQVQEEAPAPEPASEPEVPALTCESCSGTIESQDQADLSRIRFRKMLCRSCFSASKRK